MWPHVEMCERTHEFTPTTDAQDAAHGPDRYESDRWVAYHQLRRFPCEFSTASSACVTSSEDRAPIMSKDRCKALASGNRLHMAKRIDTYLFLTSRAFSLFLSRQMLLAWFREAPLHNAMPLINICQCPNNGMFKCAPCFRDGLNLLGASSFQPCVPKTGG